MKVQIVKSVNFQVAGVYNHGKKEGRTNPHESVLMRLFGRDVYKNGSFSHHESVKEIIERLKRETGGAFFRIVSVDYETGAESVVVTA